MIRLTLRATDDSVLGILVTIMEQRLAIGVSTTPELPKKLTKREIAEAFANVMATSKESS